MPTLRQLRVLFTGNKPEKQKQQKQPPPVPIRPYGRMRTLMVYDPYVEDHVARLRETLRNPTVFD